MKYLWTEDIGAGLHFWQFVNEYLFDGKLIVESKESNQGLLDAVRELKPEDDSTYYIAFDIVYANMDVMNKYLDLQSFVQEYPKNLYLLDTTCFEYIIFSFAYLIEWTGTGRKDKIKIREHLLNAFADHKIDIDSIEDNKTLNYLRGFKKFSTERVLKSIMYELTDMDAWSVKGNKIGRCWHQNCCVLENKSSAHCNLKGMTGKEKIMTLLLDKETQRIVNGMNIKNV